jgi:hypothetical protein
MGLGKILADFAEKAKNLFTGFAESISIREQIKSHHRLVMIIAAAMLIIVLLLLILVLVSHSGDGSRQADSGGFVVGDSLSDDAFYTEDFFLPYEPDFVPDVLLEREPRDGWSEEDARPFWTDPLEGNEALWRKRMESGIDSLLEKVP